MSPPEAESTLGSPGDHGPQRLPRRTLIQLTVAFVVVVTYFVAVFGSVIPTSPLRDALRPMSRRIIVPFFIQRWTLFAPSPPSANLYTFVAVRYSVARRTKTIGPFDVSTAVRERSRSQPWAPPRPAHALTKINVELERWMSAAVRDALAAGIDTARPPDAFRRNVTARGRQTLAAYRRFLSAAAREVVPSGAELESVRGILVRTPLVPFDGRTPERSVLIPPELAKRQAFLSPDLVRRIAAGTRSRPVLLFDSDWMPAVKDIAPLGVALS